MQYGNIHSTYHVSCILSLGLEKFSTIKLPAGTRLHIYIYIINLREVIEQFDTMALISPFLFGDVCFRLNIVDGPLYSIHSTTRIEV